MRTRLAASLIALTLTFPLIARAGEQNGTQPRKDHDVVVGVLGGVGFPRPLAIEPVIGVDKAWMLGVEYSFLPKANVASVQASAWAAAGDLRIFPFGKGFFIGLRGGYQRLAASADFTPKNAGAYTESIDAGTWFLNPRIGILVLKKPFAIGLDGGVQIPLSTIVEHKSTLSSMTPDANTQVTSLANTFGRTIIPTIDLLRIGLVL